MPAYTASILAKKRAGLGETKNHLAAALRNQAAATGDMDHGIIITWVSFGGRRINGVLLTGSEAMNVDKPANGYV